MDLLEVAVRELISGFRVFALLIVHPQMPLRVFSKSVQTDEPIEDGYYVVHQDLGIACGLDARGGLAGPTSLSASETFS